MDLGNGFSLLNHCDVDFDIFWKVDGSFLVYEFTLVFLVLNMLGIFHSGIQDFLFVLEVLV